MGDPCAVPRSGDPTRVASHDLLGATAHYLDEQRLPCVHEKGRSASVGDGEMASEVVARLDLRRVKVQREIQADAVVAWI
jgi:hypothetical protein